MIILSFSCALMINCQSKFKPKKRRDSNRLIYPEKISKDSSRHYLEDSALVLIVVCLGKKQGFLIKKRLKFKPSRRVLHCLLPFSFPHPRSLNLNLSRTFADFCVENVYEFIWTEPWAPWAYWIRLLGVDVSKYWDDDVVKAYNLRLEVDVRGDR